MNPENKIVTDRSLIDENKWAAFIKAHSNGNIFHSPAMVRLYEETGFEKPVTLFYLDNKGIIKGVLSAFILHEGKSLFSWLTSRAVIWGGPVSENGDSEISDSLLKSLNEELRGSVTYIQIRNLTDTSKNRKVFTDNGYKYDDHLNILFDLKKTYTLLWDEMHPTRRKQINRSARRGVTTFVSEAADEDTVTRCYDILKDVYKRAGLPLPDLSFFLRAAGMRSSDYGFRVATAVCENKIIGFRFFLLFSGLLYDWYAGSDDAYYDKYPNDVLPWAIIKWGSEKGYHTFDFGGAGHPREKYGVRDYKMKFGGKVVNYGRYLFVQRPLVYYPAKFAMKIKNKLF